MSPHTQCDVTPTRHTEAPGARVARQRGCGVREPSIACCAHAEETVSGDARAVALRTVRRARNAGATRNIVWLPRYDHTDDRPTCLCTNLQRVPATRPCNACLQPFSATPHYGRSLPTSCFTQAYLRAAATAVATAHGDTRTYRAAGGTPQARAAVSSESTRRTQTASPTIECLHTSPYTDTLSVPSGGTGTPGTEDDHN